MPLVGQPAVLEFLRSQEVRGRLLSVIPSIFVLLLMTIAAAGAVWIWVLDGRRPTYFWLMLALLCEMGAQPVTLASLFSMTANQDAGILATSAIGSLELVCWLLFWRRWFQLDKSKVADGLVGFLLSAAILTEVGLYVFSQRLAVHEVLLLLHVRTLVKVLLGSMLLVALGEGARKDGWERCWRRRRSCC